jgi:transposase
MKSRARGTAADITRAREALAQAQTVEQLRQAIAVLLPLDYGLSLEKTAQIIGHSPVWTSRLRNRFLAGDIFDSDPRRGGRFNQHMTEEQEREIIIPYLERLHHGRSLNFRKIKADIEATVGYSIAASTIYKMLRRHGWDSGRVRSCYKKEKIINASAGDKEENSRHESEPDHMNFQEICHEK